MDSEKVTTSAKSIIFSGRGINCGEPDPGAFIDCARGYVPGAQCVADGLTIGEGSLYI